MKVRGCLLAVGLCFAINAWGQGTASLGYTQIDDSDIALGASVATVGYRFELNDSLALVPELRGGVGIRKDTFEDVTYKLKGLAVAGLRAEFSPTESVYLFTAISYGRYRFKARAFEVLSISDSTDEFGFGGGIGFRVSEDTFLELGYEDIDDIDVLSVGVRFHF